MKQITITTSQHITADSHPNLYRQMQASGWTGRQWAATGTRGATYYVWERASGDVVILDSRFRDVRGPVEITNREEIA